MGLIRAIMWSGRPVPGFRMHFKAYDSKFDEWRPFDQDGQYSRFVRRVTPRILTGDSLPDRVNLFTDLLYRAVNSALNSGRKDDPEVRLEVDVLGYVFNNVLGNIVNGILDRGKLTYSFSTNRMVDNVLGEKLGEGIVNTRGNFCFVAEGTVK